MLGLLFGFLTRPHALGPDGIRVRSGAEIDIPLPWEAVESVGRDRRATQDKQPQVSIDTHGNRALHLRMQHETNVAIRLRQPVTAQLPGGPETVSLIHLFADQPEAFVREAARQVVAHR